jgi:hypothetical protein
VSRPIERCHEISQCTPIMAEVTAATEHQTYQGTVVLRELTGMEAVVALKPSIIDLSTSGRPDGMFFRSNMPLNRVSPQVGIKSVDPVSQGTPDSTFPFSGASPTVNRRAWWNTSVQNPDEFLINPFRPQALEHGPGGLNAAR